MVVDYLKAHGDFGMRIEVSREDTLLDTGGGLKKVGFFFLESGSTEPFILHNVDVISTIDLTRMLQFHREHQALATLAVQDRPTSRYLLFNQHLQLCGRRSGAEQKELGSSTPEKALAFSGIHIISPRLLEMIAEEGMFSIIPCYLRLAALGEKIIAFRADEYYWRDMGKPENLSQAEADLQRKILSL